MPRPIDRLADCGDCHSTAMVYSRCNYFIRSRIVVCWYLYLQSHNVVSLVCVSVCTVELLVVYTILNLYFILFVFLISFVCESV